MSKNPNSPHGPYSTGGFKGKNKPHKGDHRPAKKSSGGGTTGGMMVIPIALVAVPMIVALLIAAYLAHGYMIS